MELDTEATVREAIGEASFSVSARVAIQLGRESISSSIVAVLELVKNAFDADATKVEIRFQGLDTDNVSLILEDDGIGMTEEQLRDHWMVLGTDNKKNTKRSQKRSRILVGEKGLGRLGLDRLARYCLVQSFPESADYGLELQIDWTKYEQSGIRLETVKHPIYRTSKQVRDSVTGKISPKPNGVRLVLTGLKERWTEQDLKNLRGELSLLVSPFDGINDFSISLDSGSNWPDVDGRVGAEEMVEAALWKISSALSVEDGVGYVTHEMSTPYAEAVFTFRDTWEHTVRDASSALPACGPLTFQFYWLPRAVSEVEEFEQSVANITQAQINTFLNANQGIRIYRDGFRVKPYGDPSGERDWLNLSFRRQQSPGGVRQGGWRVGYNQVVGAVFISREKNNQLIDQTNREGIVEGLAYADLRRFVLKAIDFFEDSRSKYARARSKPSRYEDAQDEAAVLSREATAAVDALKGTVDTITRDLELQVEEGQAPGPVAVDDLRDAVSRVERALESKQKADQKLALASEQQLSEWQRQKDTLSNLASLGILAAAFSHETLGAANVVVNNTDLLREGLTHLLFVEPDILADIQTFMNNIGYGAGKIETFSEFILKNVRRDKRQRVKLTLEEVADAVFASLNSMLQEDQGIRIERDFPEHSIAFAAFRIDWESILINLITNAVWALEDTPREQRVIRVRVRSSDGRLRLSFADSGRGIEAGSGDRIFLATFSTKRSKKGDVIGTGMGLAIVSNFVQSYQGTIRVESPSDLGGAEFHIEIPLPSSTDTGGA